MIQMFVGALLGFCAAVFAEPLRLWMFRPKLELEFGDTPEYQAHTPEREVGGVHYAYYIRIKVTNTKSLVAKNCRAYLVAVEKEDQRGHFLETIYRDSIQLSWACRGDQAFGPQDLPRDVPHFVDVLSTRSVSGDFQLQIAITPFRYTPLVSEHGTFRFTVMVSGENIKPVQIRIRFRWDGVWDKFKTWQDKA